MSWIKVIGYEEAKGSLKRMYDRVKGPDNNIDNVLSIHSLRPHTLKGHMTLYKSVLHNTNNTLPKWYLEAIGVYVSYLNKCDYCVQHHLGGFTRLLDDDVRATAFYKSVQEETVYDFFENHYKEGIAYAQKLTQAHHTITKEDIDYLKTLVSLKAKS